MLKVTWSNQAIAWVARIVGILFAAMAAWGWWDESQARQDPGNSMAGDWLTQWAVYTHLLPLILIVLGLIFGWKQPFYGALAFGLYAVLQAISVGTEWAYLPLVVAPPLVIALLFKLGWFVAWRKDRKASKSA